MRSFTIIAGLAVCLAACTSGERTGAAGSAGGTVVVEVNGDAHYLLPTLAEEETGAAVSELLFDPLAAMPRNLSTIGDSGWTPMLAKSWTWSPDSLSIAFSLDPRARWHDGQPVRAADVRFGYLLTADPKTAAHNAPFIGNIDSVSVRDSLTAVAWFKKRSPSEFFDFVYQIAIVPEHVYGAIPRDELKKSETLRKPVGSGRFRFVRWDPGQRIEVIADTANYRGRPPLDRVIVAVNSSPTASAAELLKGTGDFFYSFPFDQVPKLDSNPNTRGIAFSQLGSTFMGMNAHDPKSLSRPHPIFGDRAVRRALSMAVDRKAMLDNVFGKYGHLAKGPVALEHPSADTSVRIPAFDLAAAKALLDSAGWRESAPGGTRSKNGRPLRFSLLTPTSSLPRMKYAVLLQEQLKHAGADVQIEQVEFPAFMTRNSASNFDAILGGASLDPNLAAAKQYWASSAIGQEGNNTLRYSNPTVDALLDSAGGALNPGQARRYAARAYQLIADDAPAIWLYDLYPVAAAHRRLQIPYISPLAWWRTIPEWSIPPNARIDRDRIGLGAAKQ